MLLVRLLEPSAAGAAQAAINVFPPENPAIVQYFVNGVH
jgi:hypothetical protein